MEITRGVIPCAKKIVIYGPEGIGKSTMASQFPEPVFIDTEGSTSHMDVARLPKPSSWQMLLQAVQYVRDNPSCCRTLVIDTADWTEKLCIEEVCAVKKVKGIEDIGYGKGYTYVKESFGKLLNLLDEVIDRGIHVVLTAHAQMRKFEQPDELGAYDRWEMKLSKQTAPLVKEWSDMLLFCNYKTMVVNVDNQGAQKGKNKAQGGRRVMYTAHHACWDAKNRFGLPEEAEMEYGVIRGVIEGPAASSNAANKIPEEAAKSYSIPDGKQMDMLDYQHVKNGDEIKTLPQKQPVQPPSDEQPGQAEKSTEESKKAAEENLVSLYYSDPAHIPKNLKDLMEQNDIGEWYIQEAVAVKGYYPTGTLIENMDPEFVQGVLVGAWPDVYKVVKEIKEKESIPF